MEKRKQQKTSPSTKIHELDHMHSLPWRECVVSLFFLCLSPSNLKIEKEKIVSIAIQVRVHVSVTTDDKDVLVDDEPFTFLQYGVAIDQNRTHVLDALLGSPSWAGTRSSAP